MKYVIVTDAAADTYAGFFRENEIEVIPMVYGVGDAEYVSDCNESDEFLKEFYDKEREKTAVRSTQIVPNVYLEAFEKILKTGTSVLYVSLSGGLSNTYESSLIAAKQLSEQYHEAEVVCVDSRAATVGMGLLLYKLAENKKNGMSLHENARWAEENRLKMAHWFVVDDLMFLKRGGRVPTALALFGTVLDIKPILTISAEGKLISVDKKHGMKAALANLVSHYNESAAKSEGEPVFIVHTDAESNARIVESKVLALNPNADIHIVNMGPVIGVHVGPGFCGLVFEIVNPDFIRR